MASYKDSRRRNLIKLLSAPVAALIVALAYWLPARRPQASKFSSGTRAPACPRMIFPAISWAQLP
jgi:hypothetical protein